MEQFHIYHIFPIAVTVPHALVRPCLKQQDILGIRSMAVRKSEKRAAEDTLHLMISHCPNESSYRVDRFSALLGNGLGKLTKYRGPFYCLYYGNHTYM